TSRCRARRPRGGRWPGGASTRVSCRPSSPPWRARAWLARPPGREYSRQMLACPVPLEEFEESVADPLAARFFPPAAYTEEAFYRFELAAVWEREWLCVGRLEE